MSNSMRWTKYPKPEHVARLCIIGDMLYWRDIKANPRHIRGKATGGSGQVQINGIFYSVGAVQHAIRAYDDAPAVKPPLGIMPAHVWEAQCRQERCRQLVRAIRDSGAHSPHVVELFDELEKLV